MAHTTLQIPEELHEGMQTVRQAQRLLERKRVSLWEVYAEAVRFYLAARPQRELLKAYAESQVHEPDPQPEEPREELYAGR